MNETGHDPELTETGLGSTARCCGRRPHRQANSVRVCSPTSRRVASLRPRSAGLTALTPAPRTLVQIGSCRRCSLIHPLHVVVDVPSRMTLFRATADTSGHGGRAMSGVGASTVAASIQQPLPSVPGQADTRTPCPPSCCGRVTVQPQRHQVDGLVADWPRDVDSAYALMLDLSERVKNRIQLTSDGLGSVLAGGRSRVRRGCRLRAVDQGVRLVTGTPTIPESADAPPALARVPGIVPPHMRKQRVERVWRPDGWP